MTTGTTDWSAIAPFLVALSGFAALFQGVAKAVKPAPNANWNEVFGKWIDVLASAGGGFIALVVFYFWADQMGLRLTRDEVRNLIGLMVFLVLAVAGLAIYERCRLQAPKPKGDDAKKDA